jgi:hypothetical protein
MARIYYYSLQNQGLILSRVILNLNQKQYYLGLFYIIVSRVKILAGFLFEILFDFDRFVLVDSAISKDKKLDYTFRNI